MNALDKQLKEFLDDPNKSLDIYQYKECIMRMQSKHNKSSLRATGLSILFLCISLWSMYSSNLILAGFFFFLAITQDTSTTCAASLSNYLTTNLLQLNLINSQNNDEQKEAGVI